MVHTVELGEVPTRYLADDIVEGWFEEGAGGLRDGVLQLEESVTEAELGSDEGQGLACGFACKSR